MVGHSLGAGVAAGAAGYYADAVIASGATNRLAGIVLLDSQIDHCTGLLTLREGRLIHDGDEGGHHGS